LWLAPFLQSILLLPTAWFLPRSACSNRRVAEDKIISLTRTPTRFCCSRNSHRATVDPLSNVSSTNRCARIQASDGTLCQNSKVACKTVIFNSAVENLCIILLRKANRSLRSLYVRLTSFHLSLFRPSPTASCPPMTSSPGFQGSPWASDRIALKTFSYRSAVQTLSVPGFGSSEMNWIANETGFCRFPKEARKWRTSGRQPKWMTIKHVSARGEWQWFSALNKIDRNGDSWLRSTIFPFGSQGFALVEFSNFVLSFEASLIMWELRLEHCDTRDEIVENRWEWNANDVHYIPFEEYYDWKTTELFLWDHPGWMPIWDSKHSNWQ
jgi:hypothetical protein